MKQLVVFDLDDTLYLEKRFVESGFLAVNSFLIKRHKINGFYDKAWHRFKSGEKKYIFNNTLDDLKYSGDSSKLVEELVKIYRAHMPNIALEEDAKWAIKHFSSLHPIALLSDGYLHTQKNKVDSLKISTYFNKIYYTDYWGRESWKPSTIVFETLQKDFSNKFENYVYISDNPSKDFIAPNKLGWKSICIQRDFGIYNGVSIPSNGKPNIFIKSLFELEDLLPL